MINIILPLITPLFSATFCVLFWRKVAIQRIFFIGGIFATVVFSGNLAYYVHLEGIISVQIGNWEAPFGITLIADLFSAGVILAVTFVTLMIAIYAQQSLDKYRISYGFFPIMLFLLFGVCGALLTGDIFNLYVWFEIIMVSSFVLLTLGGTKDQLEGAVKYVAINFLASSLLLAGIGVMYGITGSLNMADIAQKLPEIEQNAMFSLASVFFMVGFGIKAAVFPLFFWLPAAYPTPPIAITAMIGGLLSKVGAYVLIRFFTLIFTHDLAFTHEVLLVAAGLTMVSGGIGAIAQKKLNSVLSFSIVSQIGYIIMGLALFTPLALAGSIFFIVHNILVKTNLFLIGGIVYASNRTYDLKKLGGVYKRFPVIALLFIIAAFSLTGLPPLTGFWGKYLLATAGLQISQFVIVGIAIGTGVLTLFYMTKIWNEVFWKKDPEVTTTKDLFPTQVIFLRRHLAMVFPVVMITLVVLYMGLFPELFIDYAMNASEQLMNKEHYINAVFK